MEGREILIEVDTEEVQILDPGLCENGIVSEDFVIVCGSLSRDWPDLLVAASIAWDEENWDAGDLGGLTPLVSTFVNKVVVGSTLTFWSSSTPCSR